MNRYGNLKKLSDKGKKIDVRLYEEAPSSFKELKRERYDKLRKNYDNALRSKNLDRLLSYDEE
jgi:hypothetical protein